MKKNNILSHIIHWLNMVKFEHTIFSAPFLILSVVYTAHAYAHHISPDLWLWCILSLVGARSTAMMLNRIVDQHIDALNPRTKNRHLPAGIVSQSMAYIYTVCSIGILIIGASHLPILCLQLAPLAVLGFWLYPYLKRYTFLCHYYLGTAVAGAVLGGHMAVTGLLPDMQSWVLFLSVTMWIAGFDIIYAMLDIEYDREYNVHSIPAKYGIKTSLIISAITHAIAIVLFYIWIVYTAYSSVFFEYLAIAYMAVGLAFEHFMVHKYRDDHIMIDNIFFWANAYIATGIVAILLLGHYLG